MSQSWLSVNLFVGVCFLAQSIDLALASPPPPTRTVPVFPRTAISNITAAITSSATDAYTGGYYTYSTFLPTGTIVLEVPVGPTGFSLSATTLVGPTTFLYPYPTGGHDVVAGSNSLDPHCNQTSTGPAPGRYVTVAQELTVLTADQTVAIYQATEQSAGTPPYAPSYENFTYTGPSTVSYTTVYDLFPMEGPDYADGEGGYPAGQACGGGCGVCRLLFPEVFVYYWPVSDPNTACLTSAGTTTAAPATRSDMAARGVPVQVRGLSGVSGAGGTLVNPNGFTFTSPSVYIAFPTIQAVDDCGNLGSIHTSTTIGFPEGGINTVVIAPNGTKEYFPFDFADALCPPASLSASHSVSILGQTGYNPIISPPAGLTVIDPAWVQACQIPAFQGNDPPYALLPQTNLSPSPTGGDPGPSQTPASPSPSVPAIPIETNAPQSTIFTPSTATDMGPVPSDTSIDPPVSPQSPPVPPQSSPVPPQNPPASSQSPPSPPPNPPNPPTSSQDPTDPSSDPQQSLSPAAPYNPVSTNAASAVQVGSQTLIAGGAPVVYSGTTYALASSASAIIVNGVSSPLPAPSPNPPATIQVGGQPFTANSATAFIIGSQTLVAGGPAITVSNTPVSLAPSASFVVVGSSTQALGAAPVPAPANTAIPPIVTVAGQTFTGNAASGLVAGTQTLTPGGVITVSGTPISLALSGSYLVAGTSTIALPTPAPAPAPTVLTLAGQAFTENTASDFIINGQTLAPGSAAITVSGTPISLAAIPTDVVVGNSTQGLGGLIINPFTGAASRDRTPGGYWGVKGVGSCMVGVLGAGFMIV